MLSQMIRFHYFYCCIYSLAYYLLSEYNEQILSLAHDEHAGWAKIKPLKFWTCLLYNLAYVDQYIIFSDEEIKIAWGSMGESEEKVTGALTVPSSLTDWLWKAWEQTNGWIFILLSPECKGRVWKQRSNTVILGLQKAHPGNCPWLRSHSLSLEESVMNPIEDQTPSIHSGILGKSAECLGFRGTQSGAPGPAEQVRLVGRGIPRRAFSSCRDSCWLCCVVFLNDQNTAQK